ncbi:V-type ATP synthase subunit E family protein [Acidocella facilis]|uniref:hypothetical protein n=1 Tax=Acidocella facilis TaxID=525 RepID=UPI001F23E158|nr:hypothetical protein [Acidocella facilis]
MSCDYREPRHGQMPLCQLRLQAMPAKADVVGRRAFRKARRLRASSWKLDARRSTLDARRSTLDARRSTLDARRSTLDARRSTLLEQYVFRLMRQRQDKHMKLLAKTKLFVVENRFMF